MKKTAGYSLLEIVVCIALVALIVVGTAAAFATASRLNAKARGRLHEEIAVQSAAEIALAEGISASSLTSSGGKTVGEIEIAPSDKVSFEVKTDAGSYFEIELTRGETAISLRAKKVP